MKKNIISFIILAALVGTVYQYRQPVSDVVSPIMSDISDFIRGVEACEEPIPYVLGTFSTEFNISKEYYLKAIADAEAIWEKEYGKELFAYEPTNTSSRTLKVNLIYDYRQQATSKLKSLGIQVDNNRASYDSLKAKLDTLRTEYTKKKNDFNARVNAFNKKQDAYEEQVEYWNSRGGAPQSEYQELEQTRRELEAEAKALQSQQNAINSMGEEINAIIVTLNKLIQSLNLSVEKYNTVSEARGESFEEGVYHSDGRTKEIDVYEFSNRDKLIRVLAHELGHALGLDHVDDSKAIMYELNQGNTKTLTEADITALNALCVQSK